jgi:predicted HicB family RNase H-like nuclease
MYMKKPTSIDHRSLTIRIPLELYIELADLANTEGTSLNEKISQLIQLGLGQHVNLDAALRRLLIKEVING